MQVLTTSRRPGKSTFLAQEKPVERIAKDEKTHCERLKDEKEEESQL